MSFDINEYIAANPHEDADELRRLYQWSAVNIHEDPPPHLLDEIKRECGYMYCPKEDYEQGWLDADPYGYWFEPSMYAYTVDEHVCYGERMARIQADADIIEGLWRIANKAEYKREQDALRQAYKASEAWEAAHGPRY